jgi:hypothetical protein
MTTTAVKERPIIFSGHSVRRIAADAKTQTRRAMNVCPPGDATEVFFWSAPDHARQAGFNIASEGCYAHTPRGLVFVCKCPYGIPGDRLYVKESWSPDHAAFYPNFPVVYQADNPIDEITNGKVYSPEAKRHFPFRWRPSIYMPRRVSRIILEITEIRVQRLRDIDDDDVLAEGTPLLVDETGTKRYIRFSGKFAPGEYLAPIKILAGESHSDVDLRRAEFASLWDTLNFDRGFSWESNPFVWAVSFKRVAP